MSWNPVNVYDLDPHIPEIYDRFETQVEDVALLRKLIGGSGPLRILEPFCGNGRIFIPLAQDGHEIVGLDQSGVMLASARGKLARLSEEVRRRVTLRQADATTGGWPPGFDLVLLGGNCFYELATPEEQEGCIRSAAGSLRAAGLVYVDNNHMEGPLAADWCVPGVGRAFPTGVCEDGTRVEGTTETIWTDRPRRLWRARRTVTITRPDRGVSRTEYEEQKHPVSHSEVKTWLESHGFDILHVFGDRTGRPYSEASPRAIFWAKKRRKRT